MNVTGSAVGHVSTPAKLYSLWLDVRCVFIGLKTAWVSAASAAIGLLLFLVALPAQDTLLEVSGDLKTDLVFWGTFYLLVATCWALPVFISARWILGAVEQNSSDFGVEPVPIWVRKLIPGLLATSCFAAVLVGQFTALRNAPEIRDGNAEAAIRNASDIVGKKITKNPKQWMDTCRQLEEWTSCKSSLHALAVVVGARVAGPDRSNAPFILYGLLGLLIIWIFLRETIPSNRVARRSLFRGAATLIMLLFCFAIFLIYYKASSILQSIAGVGVSVSALPSALILPLVAFLAWRGRGHLLWWTITVYALPAVLFLVFALYGAIETERVADFNVAHLLLLPIATFAATAICWWWVRPRAESNVTAIGQFLLLGSGQPKAIAEATRLVRRIFLSVLAISLLGLLLSVTVHPLLVTQVVHRALLLPPMLGLPVAVLTYLTYLSFRARAPLILAGALALSALGVIATPLTGDRHRIRMALSETDAPARHKLDEEIKRWATANGCKIPAEAAKPCPAPIIVAAAGGASRAAFHTAGVIGSLIDGGKVLPIKGHTAIIHSASYSPNGLFIVTAAFDKTARIWDAATGQQIGLIEKHDGYIYHAEYSSDSKRIVTASADGSAIVWEVTTPHAVKQLRHLKDHKDKVYSASFNVEGDLIATASQDHTARLWDAREGTPLGSMPHKGPVLRAAFSRTGEMLVTAGQDGLAIVWDISDRQAPKFLYPLKGHSASVNSAAFDRSDRYIVTASADKTARIWDVKNKGAQVATLDRLHSKIVYSAEFNPAGDRIATASFDGTAIIWDVSDLNSVKAIKRLGAHSGDVNSVVFSPDGRSILTASDDKTARLWDASTGKRKEWPGEPFISPFSKQLFAVSAVSGGALGAVVAYAALADSQDKDRAKNGIGMPPCVSSLEDRQWFAAQQSSTIPTDGLPVERREPSEDPERSWKACLQSLVTGDFLSPVFLGLVGGDLFGLPFREDRAGLLEQAWEVRYARLTGQETGLGLVKRDTSFTGVVTTLAKPMVTVRNDTKTWLPILLLNGTSAEDGKRIVTSDVDMSRRDLKDAVVGHTLLDASDFHDLLGTRLQMRGHARPVYGVGVSGDGRLVVTTSSDNTARVWDAVTGEQFAALVGHSSRVVSAAFSPDSRRVVTGAWDHTARVWDIYDMKTVGELRRLRGHDDDINSVTFSPDGDLILTASDDRTARLWDAWTAAEVATIAGHDRQVSSAAFNSRGDRVVTGSWDRTAAVWDVSDPKAIKELVRLRGHTDDVNAVSFSPNGDLVATGSDDKSVRIWNSATGEEVVRIVAHEAGVYGVAFDPGGLRLATAAHDNTAVLWDISDLQTVKRLTTFTGHKGAVNSAVFNKDGTFVITGSEDHTARIWDDKGTEQLALKGYQYSEPCTQCDVRLSTAVTMSARFPLISPPGSILDQENRTVNRVVDGGYHENFGAITAMELARTLKQNYGLSPAVVLLNNDPRVAQMQCVTTAVQSERNATTAGQWFPSLTTTVSAIIAARTARGSHAAVNLCSELYDGRTESNSFAFVSVSPDRLKRDVSVSWWMSKRVQRHLDGQLTENRENLNAYLKITRMRH